MTLPLGQERSPGRHPASPAAGAVEALRRRLSAVAAAAQPPVRALWHEVLVARGTEVTAASASRSCLVLAPHPDDETLGCGATILRKRASGTRVRVVIAADGRHSHRSDVVTPEQLASVRSGEAAEACARLGVPEGDVVQLGYEDATLGAHVEQLAAMVRREIADFGPEEVLVTSALDWHPDHQALNRAVRLAAGDVPELRVADYPVWYWAEGPWLRRPRGPVLEKAWLFASDLATGMLASHPELVGTEGYLQAKRHALQAYRSQISNLTGEPGWATMDEAFLARFLRRHEIFLPWPSAGQAPSVGPLGARSGR